MPGLQPINSYRDCRQLLEALAARSNSSYAIQSRRWPDGDIRVVAFRNVRDHFIVVAGVVHLLALVEEEQLAEHELLSLLGLSGTAQVVGETLNAYSQRTVVPMVQFQIENLMTRLLETRGIRVGGFPNLAREFLRAASVSAPFRKAREMTAAAMIRNSLHNNGFHRGPTRQVKIDDYTFRFREGGRVREASWAHIHLAFSKSLDHLDEALDSAPFSGGRIVKDRFVRSVERYGY